MNFKTFTTKPTSAVNLFAGGGRMGCWFLQVFLRCTELSFFIYFLRVREFREYCRVLGISCFECQPNTRRSARRAETGQRSGDHRPEEDGKIGDGGSPRARTSLPLLDRADADVPGEC